MSSTFYYPSFSARNVRPAPAQPLEQEHSLHHPHNILQQRRQIEDVVRQREELIHKQRLWEYEQSLRLKQRKSQLGQNRQQLKFKDQKQPIYKYYQELQQKLKKVEKSKKDVEEKCLIDSNYLRDGGFEQKNHFYSRQKQVNHGKNDDFKGLQEQQRPRCRQNLLCNEIQSQRVIQQYQQQLLDKINRKDKNLKQQKSTCRQKSISAKYKLDDVAGGENIIINKRSFEGRQEDHYISHSKKTIHQKDSIKNGYQSAKHNHNVNFETININQTIKKSANTINLSQIKEPFLKHKYKTINNKKSKNQCKKKKQIKESYYSERKCKNNNTSLAYKGGLEKDSINFTNPFKRIQNRLKVSMIVFKDSQLKNNRYESNHLQNTYETQIRLRKDIKDRINNHPKVLQKHLLVITSR